MFLLRRFATLLTVLPAIAAPLVAVPVFTTSAPAPRPVHPVITNIDVAGVGPATSLRAARGAVVLKPRVGDLVGSVRHTGLQKFSMLGVTWDNIKGTAPVVVKISVHSSRGWQPWTTADPSDIAPDSRVSRTGTDAIWVGAADGVNVRVLRAGPGAAPAGIKLSAIDPGQSPADSAATPASSAAAATPLPSIVSRAQWGADESMMNWDHQYSKSVKVVFVHHTDSINNYSASQAPGIVRGIYAYHARSLGWGDIGYNFLVDRFGRIYEGRSGGIDTAVVGGHTYGFNNDSSGVGLIGNFTSTVPSASMFNALERITAWKLSRYYRNPQSTQPLTAGVSQTSGTGRSFVAGRQYVFPVISGHRDAYSTACPGNQVYGRLPAIRNAVAAMMGPRLYDPIAAPIAGSTNLPGGVSISSHLSGTLAWTVTIQDLTHGLTVANHSGRSSNVMSWDWTLPLGGAKAVLPGTYRITLSATDGRSQALPATFTLTLTGEQGGTLYPSGTFLRQGSAYWRVEQSPNGAIQRRPVLPSAVATYPGASARAVNVPNEVLSTIPVGPVLGWVDGTVVNAAHDTKDYVVSQGKLRLVPATPGLVAWNYTTDNVLVVPGAQVSKMPMGDSMSEPTHAVGSYVSDGTGATYVIVANASGVRFRRQLASVAALQSWVSATTVVPATPADLALPTDTWVRGIADGMIVRVDGYPQTYLISLGVARRVSDSIDQAMSLSSPTSVSALDLGHARNQTPDVNTVDVVTHSATATARASSPNGVVRVATWQGTFLGTPAPSPTLDPAIP